MFQSRRRQLRSVIRQARHAARSSLLSGFRRTINKPSRSITRNVITSLRVLAGYTVLVFDTNVLLSSMKLFQDLLEKRVWTLVVPNAGERWKSFLALGSLLISLLYPVITELDGLKRNATPLGIAARAAVGYLESAIQLYPSYLKVQTNRGNYLNGLAIRAEDIDFASNTTLSHDYAANMDDVILRAVSWQQEHFANKLGAAERRHIKPDTAKVVLITFDRNLRLKAQARDLDAADEKVMAKMLHREEG